MKGDELQRVFASTRIRFGMTLIAVLAIALMLPFMLFAVGRVTDPTIPVTRIGFYLILLLIAGLMIGLYYLRLRQIERPGLLALLALVPVANFVLPIFLLIENSPEERASRTAFVLAGIGIAAFVTFSAYHLANPPGFSRADPTGCYLVDGVPIFQLRNGQVLLPSGESAGVTYQIEVSDVGNSVVTDHEIGLAQSGSGPKLIVGAAGKRWNSSVDTGDGPAMIMAIGEELQPTMAVRHDRCG